MNICEELHKKSLRLLEAYETDLAIDRKWIEENPDVPFLHYTRTTGTHLITMPKDEGEAIHLPVMPDVCHRASICSSFPIDPHELVSSHSITDYS